MNQVSSWLIKNNKSNIQIKYTVLEVLKLNGKKKTTVQKFVVRMFLINTFMLDECIKVYLKKYCYSLLMLPLLRHESKCAVFVFVPLNAN